MNKFIKSILDLNELEQFARRDLWLNKLHPTFKILVTLVFIIIVTSIGKYELNKVLLYGLYPIIIYSVIDIPLSSMFSKLIIPIILSISLGLFNPLIDREVILIIGGIGISGGVVSLLVLIIKASLSISSTILLVSSTTISDLGKGLEVLKIPKRLIVLLLLMYRYIGVLLSEVSKTIDAYKLRSNSNKGIHISSWGSLVGQIMIRSFRRSDEIYNAMLLRGYNTGE